MKIAIFGTWYVGLVTGTCLAEVWHEVICVDIDQQKIDNLEKGIIPIFEPGLEELVVKNFKNARLSFTTDARKAIEFWDAIFSAVGTPPDKNHRADLKYVKQVAETFAKYTTSYKVLINKSTVPVGTGKEVKDIISQNLDTSLFDIVSNPEFLREWTAVKDFMVPDRIVCGVENDRAKKVMEQIYAPFTRNYCPLIFSDIASAEIAKYAANSFLATKLSFINEIANFSEKTGGNIWDIVKIIGSDKRIWNKFLHAGIWYGWSCFPKDVAALIETGKDFGYDFEIIKATESVNKKQKTRVIGKLQKHISDLTWTKITLWGLSYKPKTDDTRDAPSIDVIKKLIDLWVTEISCYDPEAMKYMKQIFQNESRIKFYDNSYNATKNSDALIILTEWDEFRWADIEKIKNNLKQNIIIDGRNIWNKKDIENSGFIYEWIGY